MKTTISSTWKLITSVGVVLCLVLAQAQTMSAREADDALSAFQYVYTTSAFTDLTVPSVVEVPITDTFDRALFAVEEVETGNVVAHYYRVVHQSTPQDIAAWDQEGVSLHALTDGSYNTTIDFPLIAEDANVVVVHLSADEPVTSSQIKFNLARNVALPHTAKLTAITDEGERIIVATTRVHGTTLSFPATTASIWKLALTYVQPLRFTELQLVQDDVAAHTAHSIRFLAQPNYTYRIYADPDRAVTLKTNEGGNLHDNEGVVVVSATGKTPNTTYVIADSDEDNVPDIIDNCVSVPNTDQKDIDNNGRGDACDDFDRDGVLNHTDNCDNNPNRNQADEDGDGIGDVCDEEESRITEKYVWIPWAGLGLVVLVILGMFLVILRRSIEQPEVVSESVADRGEGNNQEDVTT